MKHKSSSKAKKEKVSEKQDQQQKRVILQKKDGFYAVQEPYELADWQLNYQNSYEE